MFSDIHNSNFHVKSFNPAQNTLPYVISDKHINQTQPFLYSIHALNKIPPVFIVFHIIFHLTIHLGLQLPSGCYHFYAMKEDSNMYMHIYSWCNRIHRLNLK